MLTTKCNAFIYNFGRILKGYLSTLLFLFTFHDLYLMISKCQGINSQIFIHVYKNVYIYSNYGVRIQRNMFLCVDYICAFFVYRSWLIYFYCTLLFPIILPLIYPHRRSNDNIPTMYWVGVSLAVHRINKPFVYF